MGDDDRELDAYTDPRLARFPKPVLYLGGATLAVLVVALIAARLRGPGPRVDPHRINPNIDPGDWQVSLQRVVGAFEVRLQLMDNRFDELSATLVQMQAPQPASNGFYNAPTQPGAAPARTAAVSLPAEGLVPPNPAFAVPPAPQMGEQLPPPPVPAAVSVMP